MSPGKSISRFLAALKARIRPELHAQNDDQLLRLFKSGDQAAFEALVWRTAAWFIRSAATWFTSSNWPTTFFRPLS